MTDKEKVWEIARRIAVYEEDGGFSTNKLYQLFGCKSPTKVFRTKTIEEVESILEYNGISITESVGKKEEYNVGDIIENKNSGSRYIIVRKSEMNDLSVYRAVKENGELYGFSSEELEYKYKLIGNVTDKQYLATTLTKLIDMEVSLRNVLKEI